jgi:hypothetical protein
MPSGIVLGHGLDSSAVPVAAVSGVVISVTAHTMFVRGWPVMVIRMVVVGVRVQMPGRGRRHGQGHGLHEGGGDQTPHGGPVYYAHSPSAPARLAPDWLLAL